MSDKRTTELLCTKHGFMGYAADEYGRPKSMCPECGSEAMWRASLLKKHGYTLAPWQDGVPVHQQLWKHPGLGMRTLQQIIKEENITTDR